MSNRKETNLGKVPVPKVGVVTAYPDKDKESDKEKDKKAKKALEIIRLTDELLPRKL